MLAPALSDDCRIAIAAYLGASDVFDQAIAQFAATCAGQDERDRDAWSRLPPPVV